MGLGVPSTSVEVDEPEGDEVGTMSINEAGAIGVFRLALPGQPVL